MYLFTHRDDSPFSRFQISRGTLLLFLEFLLGVTHVILDAVDREKLRCFRFVKRIRGFQVGALEVFTIDLRIGPIKAKLNVWIS